MLSIGFVNVPEDVQLGLDSKYCLHELLATNFLAFIGNIKNAIGRSVSNQHISVHRNFIPNLLDDLAPVKVEGPIMESGLPRAAIEFDTLNNDFLIL